MDGTLKMVSTLGVFSVVFAFNLVMLVVTVQRLIGLPHSKRVRDFSLDIQSNCTGIRDDFLSIDANFPHHRFARHSDFILNYVSVAKTNRVTFSYPVPSERISAWLPQVGQGERGRAKQNISTLLGVSTLLGITWGLVFFSFGHLSTAGLYLFCILNSLQGGCAKH